MGTLPFFCAVRELRSQQITATLFFFLFIFRADPSGAQSPTASSQSKTNIVLVEKEGTVEYRQAGTTNWTPAQLNLHLSPGDWLRTGKDSRLAVRFADLSVIRKAALTTVEIRPPPARTARPTFDIKAGLMFFFSRGKPQELQWNTPAAAGVTRGTEFNLLVAEDGTTVLTLIDGEVELTNAFGQLILSSGEQATAKPGQAPTKTAVLQTTHINVIQWALYYPGILDPDELQLTPDEERTLSGSLAAYRNGDLLAALEQYPAGHVPTSDRERVYQAALLLAVGQVETAEALLNRQVTVEGALKLADAITTLIAAVKFQSRHPLAAPVLATEWLATSYYRQSKSDLNGALAAARAAVAKSPRFGFAWAQLAELEFGFGRVPQARAALDKALGFSPRNAQALALRGFIFAAENQLTAAYNTFEQAIAVDGALGNAWLGRGLVRIHRGETAAGRADLQMAAALEPQRALFRSYLAKAFENDYPRLVQFLDLPQGLGTPEYTRALKELDLAKHLDAKDPTAWLYSALLNRQQNQINAAVTDLEHSQELNDNRNLFRSRLLLDQDQAVRGANLAAIYRDAGLLDVSVREAARAVDSDYANYSAHLFLANSYDALRDPRQVSLRYETPWFNELLLANLLAPVGAGSLSQTISQQEYSKLFERDRIGFSSGTAYSSGGDWQQYGSHFGTLGNSSYAFDAVYLSQNGQRPNEDIDQLTFWAKVKQQLTPQDSLFLQAVYYENESGDVRQYYDPRAAHLNLRFKEKQAPNIFLGYHREWTPGSHTLFLAARLEDQVTLNDPAGGFLVQRRATASGPPPRVVARDFPQSYRSDLDAYSIELQHFWQRDKQTLMFGGRFQAGTIETESDIFPRTTFPQILSSVLSQSNSTDLERFSLYGYYYWQIIPAVRVIGGLSYDRLVFPENIDQPPISNGQRARDQVSPKGGLIWNVTTDTILRATYTRSLGGLYYDTSVRLEPSQIAGFNQAFRSAIPESVAGITPGSKFETWGIGLDQKFASRTYLGIDGDILRSEADRTLGMFDVTSAPAVPASARENLDYEEKSLAFRLNQLIGDNWALGARYRLSEAHLHDRMPEISTALFPDADRNLRGTLQQLWIYALFFHRCGLFAQAESWWTRQSNRGYTPDQPGDDFWQFNSWVGYRFPRRLAEASMGVLNITGQDYQLNPLNLHPELPRERTLVVRLKFNF
jgi:Tfp pilus assembly protein PilF